MSAEQETHMERTIPAQVLRQQEEIDAFDAELEAITADPSASEATSDLTPPPVDNLPPAVPAAPEEDWRQKYLTLQGMFNAEVPRLTQQLREVQAKLDQALKRPAPPAVPEAPAKVEKTLTDKDVETFGADMVDLVQRAVNDGVGTAEARFAIERGKLEARIADLTRGQESVSQHVEQNNRTAYLAELGRLCPEYETVNVDPGFLAWLEQTDEMAGVPRQSFLEDAFKKFDAARTAKMFNTWKGVSAPPPAPKASSDLERQTSPGSSRSSAPVTPSLDEARAWTGSEIDRFYRDMTSGKYVGREAEAAKIEAAIDKAAAEGRLKQ